MLGSPFDLPIEAILPQLIQMLGERANAVLTAEPGAGKTTRVPLAMLQAPWLAGQRIVLLEPRRLAARAAAARLAQQLGEEIGGIVGLRMRMERRESAKTQILVVTEGVFARMILDDPGLERIGAVIFDEFHERSLDGDLGLALALDSQSAFRPDLRLLAMSATIEGERVAKIMNEAQLLRCEGRAFPVETIYLGRDGLERIEAATTRAILRALREQTGSILAFLPGQGEIERVARDLGEKITDPGIVLAPLYGALDKQAQLSAIAPAAPGKRKIVLATDVAQTSLTIEDVRVVVDSGLARAPRFEPGLGLTRLETIRASRASVDQRRGRAGRTAPGVCYRLWEEAATGALPSYPAPEILNADLSALVLSLAEWGVASPDALNFLDLPPVAAWTQAQKNLGALGALDAEGRLTPTGRALRALPLAPRLAAMTIKAGAFGGADKAARIALLLSERGLGGDAVDIEARLDRFARESSPRTKAARALAKGLARAASEQFCENASDVSCGALIALAYPERIARARGRTGEFLMANGRAGVLESHLALANAPFLAVAELTGKAGAQRILSAAEIAADEIEILFAEKIESLEELFFNPERMAVEARAIRRLGALSLEARRLKPPADEHAAKLLAQGIASHGIAHLPWSERQLQLRARINFLKSRRPEDWPDLSDASLSQTAADWLAPFVVGAQKLSDIDSTMLDAALAAITPWEVARKLEQMAPSHFETPAGAKHAIDYGAEGGPAVRVRVQELFGLKEHPSVAETPLVLHLLSPAHRPIQITQNLPQFWSGSWKDVRAEMRGRYPKHVWPDDPANATPTMRAKLKISPSAAPKH